MADVSRREFMATAAAASVAAGTAIDAQAADSPPFDPFPVEKFEELVGTSFAVLENGRVVSRIELFKVKRLGPAPRPHLRAPYCLFFRVPPEFERKQQILRLSHARMESFQQMVVPVPRQRDGNFVLQMTFN